MNKISPACNSLTSSSIEQEPTPLLDEFLTAEQSISDSTDNPSTAAQFDGVVIGTFVDLDADRRLLVDFPGNPTLAPLAAQTTVELERDQRSRPVALMFPQGDPLQPLVIGLIQNPQAKASPSDTELADNSKSPLASLQAEVDDERIVFKANKEIVLKCGKASITLTKAGKVLLRGAYVLSRSSGVNRIKGGSVQIN